MTAARSMQVSFALNSISGLSDFGNGNARLVELCERASCVRLADSLRLRDNPSSLDRC